MPPTVLSSMLLSGSKVGSHGQAILHPSKRSWAWRSTSFDAVSILIQLQGPRFLTPLISTKLSTVMEGAERRRGMQGHAVAVQKVT